MALEDRDLETGASPSSGPAGPAAAATSARRPWWIWAVPFAAVFGVLLVRNQFLFHARLYEGGDSGADSILIEQARRFTLLVGNYSREHFNHPGPAYMYVQAFGEWLARDLLHIVPTAWNGQLLAVFALDSAFGAIAAGIVYGWTRSLRGAAGCFVTFVCFAAVHPQIINSGWMPYLYVAPFFVFLLAAASVAAGRADDLWALALSGWFLIHGHVCFLFFVPVIVAPAAAAALWPHRGSPWTSARVFFRDYRRSWISALAISVVFLLPIVVNLILHWPADFGKYFAYGSSARAGGHGVSQILPFALWFWWPHKDAWIVPLALYAIALSITVTLGHGPLRRFLAAVLGINVVATLAFLIYAAAGIDVLSAYYIGYFYWSVPFLTVLVIAVGLLQAVRPRAATPLIVLGSAAVLTAVAFVPGLRTSIHDDGPALPAAVAALAARDPGKPIVIQISHDAWVDATGFLVQAERTHVRACIDQPSWTYLMTAQFICTAREAAAGVRYQFFSPAPAKGTPLIVRFGHTTVTHNVRAALPAARRWLDDVALERE
jgi:hypothetical protein